MTKDSYHTTANQQYKLVHHARFQPWLTSVGPDSERENRKFDQFWIWGLCPTLFTDKGQSLAYENTHMVYSTALNLALIAWVIALE